MKKPKPAKVKVITSEYTDATVIEIKLMGGDKKDRNKLAKAIKLTLRGMLKT